MKKLQKDDLQLNPFCRTPVYRWGMLGVILAMMAWIILSAPSFSDFKVVGLILVIPLMMLLDHLALMFEWSARAQKVSRYASNLCPIISMVILAIYWA